VYDRIAGRSRPGRPSGVRMKLAIVALGVAAVFATVSATARAAGMCTATELRSGCTTSPSLDGLDLRLADRFVVWADGCGTSLGTWAKADGLLDGGDLVELVRVVGPDAKLVQAWLNDNQFQFRSFEVTITLLDSVGYPVASWRLANVLPLKWSIEAFDAAAGKVVLEILDLTHEGVTPADPC
jgi:hypothetical protein